MTHFEDVPKNEKQKDATGLLLNKLQVFSHAVPLESKDRSVVIVVLTSCLT